MTADHAREGRVASSRGFGALAGCGLLLAAAGCSYETGSTRSKTTSTVETPTETTTTTTTKERTVEDTPK